MAVTHDYVPALERRLTEARSELERRIRQGRCGGVEELSGEYPDVWADPEAALELIYTEYVARVERGESLEHEDWFRRFPERRDRLERLFALFNVMSERDTQSGPLSETVHPDDDADDREDGADQPAGYTLLEEIGRGGSAVVYRARQHSLNRLVAIKVLRETPWLKDHEGRQLHREAELVARLQHPNIVQVFEAGTWDGMPFLAMELVPGAGLNSYLAERQKQGSVALTSDRAAELVETLARAMSYAHQHGVVHRDLKPANVLLQISDLRLQNENHNQDRVDQSNTCNLQSAIPKIADFGLAVMVDTTQSINQTMSVAGTPCYMAPEQAEGRKEDIGPRTDVYSLGAILYELLTARPPFQGATIVETLDMVRANEPVPPRVIRPQVPRDLETICLKCLNKSPGQRYSSALELAEDLRRFLDGKPIVARPVSTIERGYKWVKRYPAIAGLSLALLVSLLAGLVVQAWRIRDSEAAHQKEQQLHQDLEASLAAKLTSSARAVWTSGQIPEARQTLLEVPEAFRRTEWQSLHHLCFAEIKCWPVPELLSNVFAISPDGGRLVYQAKSASNRIRIIDTATGEQQRALDFGWPPQQVEFTADGTALVATRFVSLAAPTNTKRIDLGKGGEPATAERPSEVVVWDFATNQARHRWAVQLPWATLINRDGRRVAALHDDVIRVWDTSSGERIAELPAGIERDGRYALAWDGAGQRLAVRSKTAIQIWDVAAQSCLRTIPVDAAGSKELEKIMPILVTWADPVFFRPDGEVVLASPARLDAKSADGLPLVRQLTAWQVADGAEVFRLSTKQLTARLTFANQAFFSVNRDNNIEIVDAQTGTSLAMLRGHGGNIHFTRFSPDGRRLYSCGGDKMIRVWDLSPWLTKNP